MITSIVCKETPFVLEADRVNPQGQRTIWWIVPKTVRGATQSAVNYGKIFVEKKRGGTKELDGEAMYAADTSEWSKAVKRVQNFVVLVGSPGIGEKDSAYDHFLLRAKENPTKYVENEEAQSILIVDTNDETDLKYIRCSLSTTDEQEIMNAHADYSVLKEGAKNA